MDIKIIKILGLFILTLYSCQEKTWSKVDNIVLDYKVNGVPIIYDTHNATIKFEKNDVIKNIENYLTKNEQPNRNIFLAYLKRTNDTIYLSPDTVYSTRLDTVPKWTFDWEKEGDTIVNVRDDKDERNHYVDPMFWAAYELISEGKCEIFSKTDSRVISKYKVIYNHIPINTEYTEMKFENDTIFFSAITKLGL